MYPTILMDPPWYETGGGKIKRGADRHYRLVKTPDLPRVIIQSPEWKPADDCHLYMWATNSHLADAIWLMGTLGFKYKTNVVWTKPGRMGLGQYFRGQHELLLFGVRGKGYNVRTDNKTISSWVQAPRGKHSQKPSRFYDIIEARSHGPYLEMFARAERDGWTSWGDQVTPSSQVSTLIVNAQNKWSQT